MSLVILSKMVLSRRLLFPDPLALRAANRDCPVSRSYKKNQRRDFFLQDYGYCALSLGLSGTRPRFRDNWQRSGAKLSSLIYGELLKCKFASACVTPIFHKDSSVQKQVYLIPMYFENAIGQLLPSEKVTSRSKFRHQQTNHFIY